MPHMPAPHMTVVAKTAAAPKWPPVAQEEPPASEVLVQVDAAPIEEDDSEGFKPDFEVYTDSVPPSVARRLFDSGCKPKEPASASSESLPVGSIRLDCTAEPSSKIADKKSLPQPRQSPCLWALSGWTVLQNPLLKLQTFLHQCGTGRRHRVCPGLRPCHGLTCSRGNPRQKFAP